MFIHASMATDADVEGGVNIVQIQLRYAASLNRGHHRDIEVYVLAAASVSHSHPAVPRRLVGEAYLLVGK